MLVLLLSSLVVLSLLVFELMVLLLVDFSLFVNFVKYYLFVDFVVVAVNYVDLNFEQTFWRFLGW